MLSPGGAAWRAISRTLRTPSTTATVEALPFLITLSRTARRPSSRTMFCCTAQPSCTWPTSLRNTVGPLVYLIGMLLRSAMVVGIALLRTVYWVSPILARPDGNARGIVLHHDRRLDAGRHQGADCIRRRDDLRDGEVEIDVGLKIDLLDRDAVECLSLHVLDAGDV